MAVKKPARPKGRPKTSTGRESRETLAVYKGGREYADWLRQASAESRMPVTTMLDVALAQWAKANGIASPPSRLGGDVE
jgi:hypothetical protein